MKHFCDKFASGVLMKGQLTTVESPFICVIAALWEMTVSVHSLTSRRNHVRTHLLQCEASWSQC